MNKRRVLIEKHERKQIPTFFASRIKGNHKVYFTELYQMYFTVL